MISEHSVPTDRFSYYSLQTSAIAVLPDGMSLVIDRFVGYCMVLDCNRSRHQVVAACQFSVEELPMLFLLTGYWPSMVTYDLLATAQHPAPDMLITAAQIEDAREGGTLEHLVAPIKAQLDTYRSRLQLLSLDVKENPGYGYRLIRASEAPEETGEQ
jgi:hypothetical protein